MEKCTKKRVVAFDEVTHLRCLTIDLLRDSPQTFLDFQLHHSTGTVWKIFRHIARVNENYTSAIVSEQVRFGFDECQYHGGNNKESLLEYLHITTKHLQEVVGSCASDKQINWFGEVCNIQTHLFRLATHESLHHGQLMMCARAACLRLPASWATWGE